MDEKSLDEDWWYLKVTCEDSRYVTGYLYHNISRTPGACKSFISDFATGCPWQLILCADSRGDRACEAPDLIALHSCSLGISHLICDKRGSWKCVQLLLFTWKPFRHQLWSFVTGCFIIMVHLLGMFVPLGFNFLVYHHHVNHLLYQSMAIFFIIC